MFTQSREEHSVVTRSEPFASQRSAARWAAWCGAAGLAASIAGAIALVVSQIVFGREPIGGTYGLAVLYAATAVVGIGLAVLGRIVPIAGRASGFVMAAPHPIEGSPPPKARTDARQAA
jgi:hypothetical protein